MHLVFYSTSNVFKAEEILINNHIQCNIVPTPTQDKAYCGVCVETQEETAAKYMEDMEFEILP